eukprot:scaffold29961_cov65-Phaeocystis_antarctica.AAC.1
MSSAARAISLSSRTVTPTGTGGRGPGALGLGLRSTSLSFDARAATLACTSSGSEAHSVSKPMVEGMLCSAPMLRGQLACVSHAELVFRWPATTPSCGNELGLACQFW